LTSTVPADLTALWLPLLRRLTDECPGWGIWKNADAALAGSGDMDSAAPADAWDAIVREFRSWAKANELGPVTTCRHVDGVLFILALDRQSGSFVELDVNAKKYFRGWTMFRSEDLAPLMEIDARGFRRLRPGAEGVMLLLGNGTLWGGRPNPEGLRRKRVSEALRRDPAGVAATASRLFGRADGALVRAADRAARGEWDRRSMLGVEAWAVANALAEPGVVVGRLRSRPIKKTCPVLRTIFTDNRRVPTDFDAWVERVREAHPVYE
jgi:hypothetical protein